MTRNRVMPKNAGYARRVHGMTRGQTMRASRTA